MCVMWQRSTCVCKQLIQTTQPPPPYSLSYGDEGHSDDDGDDGGEHAAGGEHGAQKPATSDLFAQEVDDW